ncbi:acyl-CoA synthetase [Intrasporangium sp. DVR]|uniref:acyl-CoA synthetase n=1 Tax=Intrasporangium sp. DVR TaxID=3127867 RepID=UPI003341BBFB
MSPSTGYTGEPAPSELNLAELTIGRAAAAAPGRDALVVVTDAGAPAEQAERWTFAELDGAVRRVGAGLLDCGLEPGDRMLIRMGNTSDYALLHFGAMAAGLVSVPTSPQLTAEEVAFLLADCGARAAATSDALAVDLPTGVLRVSPQDVARWRGEASPAAYGSTGADDPAFLVYTSGTTGRPKGVLHAHRSAWGRRPMHDAWLGLRESDVLLHAGAFNWTYTLGVGLTDPWANRATALIYNGPRDPGVWARLVEAHGASIFAAVPGVYRQLLRSGALEASDTTSLRHGVTAGEALPPALLEEWRERTGLELYEALGMSEVSTFISSGPGTPVKPGSPGKPQPGRCVAVLPVDGGDEPLPNGQTGLLAVHRTDPGLMLGYWRRSDEEAQVLRGQWFVGGDLVDIGTDGYVMFHGRADDVMNAMGYRVSPLEVEDCLARHPSVAEVGVTEVEVRPGVRIIAAFVVPVDADDPDHVDAAGLLAHAAEHLAAYKRPREVVYVDTLPRTGNGKLRRRDLRRLLS